MRLLAFYSLLLISLLCCSEDIAGTETTNGPGQVAILECSLFVHANFITIKTLPEAQITVVSSDYIPLVGIGTTDQLTASNEGVANFFPEKSGHFRIAVASEGKQLLSQSVKLALIDDKNKGDTVVVPAGELATFSGIVYRKGKPDSTAIVYKPGTPYYAEAAIDGSFTMDSVPLVGDLLVARSRMQTWGISADTMQFDAPAGGKTDYKNLRFEIEQ